jgi:hypothetical protein
VDDSPWLLCAMCSDRIGVYEPLWLQLEDGSVHRSSYLNLGDHPGRDVSRLWHRDCLIPDQSGSSGLDATGD